LLSILIAGVAATAALWLAFNVRSTVQCASARLPMGTAVCSMHYTGMAAATLICTSSVQRSSFILGGPYLAGSGHPVPLYGRPLPGWRTGTGSSA